MNKQYEYFVHSKFCTETFTQYEPGEFLIGNLAIMSQESIREQNFEFLFLRYNI